MTPSIGGHDISKSFLTVGNDRLQRTLVHVVSLDFDRKGNNVNPFFHFMCYTFNIPGMSSLLKASSGQASC